MRNTILNILAAILVSLGISMLIPAAVSHYYHEPFTNMFLDISAVICSAGFIILLLFRRTETLRFKYIILTVVLGWLMTSLIGAVPYLISGTIHNPVDAVFESVSGFTTTGATIITDIEAMPKSILFWRSLTHWMGGMGIILLIIAILPSFGQQAMRLFQTEVSGGNINKRISPRIKKTAMFLLTVYFLLTALEIVLLLAGGMNLYESTIHSFGTVSTGGFSSKNASIGYYTSSYIQYVIILFMFLSGVNFILYCRFILGDKKVFLKNKEFKFYVILILLFTIAVTADVWGKIYHDLGTAFRMALFQVTSIMTTTGFTTADFDFWPNFSKMLLLIAMLIGGCVGSTSGAIKNLRVYVLLKSVWIEMLRVIHPNIVKNISIEDEIIPHNTVRNMIRFAMLYLIVFAAGSVIMSFFNLDMVSAISATATTLGGVGPGLGLVGAAEPYTILPAAAKIMLSLFMIIGRLEIFAFAVLFIPEFWKS